MVKIIIDDKPENLCILVPDKTGQEEFSCFITDIIPDLHVVRNTQAFPMYIPDIPDPEKPKNGTKPKDDAQRVLWCYDDSREQT